MTLRYEQLVDENLANQELLPESIPHILHQDLAYLWMLSLAPEHRPGIWRERLATWKDLLALFLLGELKLERVDVSRYPIGGLLSEAGLDSFHWLKTRVAPTSDEQARVVGVTSSTVIVRPLPTFTTELAAHIQRTHAARKRPDELRHFVALVNSRLRDEGHQLELKKILHTEFAFDPERDLRSTSGTHLELPFLKRIGWAGRSEFESVTLYVRGDSRSAWAPRCSQCRAFLTNRENESPVVIQEQAETLSLVCWKCNAETQIYLSEFLIWNRVGGQPVVWISDDATRRRPPGPEIDGIDVTYRWNAAELLGETERRSLTLRFPGRSPRAVNVEDCFFRTFVVLGKREEFKGLPIRGEWVDALADGAEVLRSGIRWREHSVEFSLRLRGLPDTLRVQRSAPAFVEEHATAALGVFPDPEAVNAEWKMFRAFLANAPSNFVTTPSNGWSQMLPTLMESKGGLPQSVTVQSAADKGTGCTFLLTSVVGTSTRGRSVVAVDFGTSNTLVHASTAQNAPERNAVDPGAAADVTLWHGGLPSGGDPAGPFFPATRDVSDRCLIPSALWTSDSIRLIRWSSTPPALGLRPVTSFKWDRRDIDEDRSDLRRAYLDELLFLTLPVISKRLGVRLSAIDLGVTYPLAFDHQQKERMRTLLDDVASDARRLMGISIESTYTISESAACVEAFGAPAEDETYLIADMGGGTLDVALVRIVNDDRGGVKPDVKQIGSLRLGGEEFIQALARSRKGQSDIEGWNIRDAVAEGTADTRYGRDPRVQHMLVRFIAIAFEYLRTMIDAHRANGSSESVKLLLVGNGWRLIDALDPSRRASGPDRVWSAFVNDFIRHLGSKEVDLYVDRTLRVPSKHLAVIGALKNATTGRRDDLRAPSEETKLPAGRAVKFGSSVVPWWRLVGEGTALTEVPPSEVRVGNIDVDREGPPPTEVWKKKMALTFGVNSFDDIPHPSVPAMRERLARGLRQTGPTLAVGPLQVIVEDTWLPTLEEAE